MDLQLKGKRALVTGSSSGIGAACARELAAEGCAVVIHGRDRARAESVARECEALGVQAAVALGSVTDDGLPVVPLSVKNRLLQLVRLRAIEIRNALCTSRQHQHQR